MGIYDPSAEFDADRTVCECGKHIPTAENGGTTESWMDATGAVEWPAVEPVERDLTPAEWGIMGEGLDADREAFAAMLNDGRLGDQPAEVHPSRPEQATEWGAPQLSMVVSDQKERGKHLFTRVAATPETMLRVEGQVGENQMGTPAEEFATDLEQKVHEYVEKFEAGDRPGAFFAYLTNDGALDGPQEGRHRAAAAMLADGIEWVPVVVLWDTSGTFRRPSSIHEGTDGYRANYPGGA